MLDKRDLEKFVESKDPISAVNQSIYLLSIHQAFFALVFAFAYFCMAYYKYWKKFFHFLMTIITNSNSNPLQRRKNLIDTCYNPPFYIAVASKNQDTHYLRGEIYRVKYLKDRTIIILALAALESKMHVNATLDGK